MLTWVFGRRSLLLRVLLEPCDGFSDSLPVLLVFYVTLGVCFLILAFSYLCGLDLLIVFGDLKIQLYLCGGFLELVR